MNKPLLESDFIYNVARTICTGRLVGTTTASVAHYMYVDPKESNIEMHGCKLINKKNAAKRVHAAGKKDVCGWVECESICVIEPEKYPLDNLEQLRYNPIVEPSWRRQEDDGEFDWDNYTFDSLVTDGNKVRVLERFAMPNWCLII